MIVEDSWQMGFRLSLFFFFFLSFYFFGGWEGWVGGNVLQFLKFFNKFESLMT